MNLISGASGFIGQRLSWHLLGLGQACRLLVRQPLASPAAACVSGDLSDFAALSRACAGVETVFHCAGHAHAFSARSAGDAAIYSQVNVEGTRNLLEAAARAGVRRFVFLSSVKAMAEPGEVCVDEHFPGAPLTAYGRSKRAAEELVLAAGRQYGMHVVNLRLAMVYGRGGRGNLERMGRLVRRGWFPPLPETGNHRSLAHVNDVVSAMCRAAECERAAGQTYIVASGEAPSGRMLFDEIRRVLGMSACRWHVPRWILSAGAWSGDLLETCVRRRLPFDREVLDRLLGSAWYSPARIERELGWRARIGLSDGLREMLGDEASA